MIKANAKKEEKSKEPKVSIIEGTLDTREFELFNFPIDRERRNRANHIFSLQHDIQSYTEQAREYRQLAERYDADVESMTARLKEAEEKSKGDKPFTVEDVQKELEKLARLPFVESVEVLANSQYVSIKTRKGMLKTQFNTRVVAVGSGEWREEFLEEPVIHELPQYQIAVHLPAFGQGGGFSDNRRLIIKLINKNDISEPLKNRATTHAAHPHWASGGRGSFNDYTTICLGEYQDDFIKASNEGFIPFFTLFAEYLQTAGDEHAYRRKSMWALGLGKKEYNPFIYREITAGESIQDIEARYKRDYRMTNAIEIPEGAQVNPGEGRTREAGGTVLTAALIDRFIHEAGLNMEQAAIVAGVNDTAEERPMRVRRARLNAWEPIVNVQHGLNENDFNADDAEYEVPEDVDDDF